ncbi:Ion channel [Synechococcus sp. MIT S9509]|uniref:potassium channel family protein n=1 Tax=unclassified Synechococcus TaxID=2626047 RepID=UPI0007BBBC55|nr:MULTISPECIES: potassium channel family protein [unclassified Synechococcus]KZR86541.1 Ion channel [Synechococcus sp. MIT S9504]KZR92519.1 Ion channel [Synechococcus sp. MIT S9509]
MQLESGLTPWKGKIYELLLGLCLLVMASFAFPRISWLGHFGYALIALLLTQLVMLRRAKLSLHDRMYQVLGIVALLTQLLWLCTPVKWYFSAVPLVLSWSLLVGWSQVRLVTRLASEHRVNSKVLMGAAAGYLLLGLTSGLVMIGIETIQPGSFEPVPLPGVEVVGNSSVLEFTPLFAQINYFAFICLTTVGFGDITPVHPMARMLSVGTGLAGQLYLAVVMGILIGRFSSGLRKG